MNVDAPQTLAQWLEQPAEGLRLLCHPDADDDLAGAWPPCEIRMARQR